MNTHFRSAFSFKAVTHRLHTYLSAAVVRSLPFLKFCTVGLTGLLVDTATLGILADPRALGLDVTLSKFCAAELAMINNFVWNEVWTFRSQSRSTTLSNRLRRLLVFNLVCGIGVILAIGLLHLFHTLLGWNLYLSNFIAIVLVACWNYVINARFNWGPAPRSLHTPIS